MTFLDTNILVYAVDKADGRKHDLALDILSTALAKPDQWRISAQVLSEFSAVFIRKRIADVRGLLAFLDTLSAIPSEPVTPNIVRRAVEIQALHGIQFYDAEILAAAEESRCRKVLSEDLSSTQDYGGISVCNPFSNN